MRGDNVLWFQRGYLLDAAEALLNKLDRWRSYRNDFPALFDELARDLPPSPGIPFANLKLKSSGGSAEELVETVSLTDVLTTLALQLRHLRLIALELAAYRDRALTGTWPTLGPKEREFPALGDPLTGSPFAWSISGDVAALVAPAARGIDAEEIALPSPRR
jgi:hypothetical protein